MFLFSNRCPVCYFDQEDNNICMRCFAKFNFLHHGCKKCQQPLTFIDDEISLCPHCEIRTDQEFYSSMCCALIYDDFLKNLILRLKNHSDFKLVDIFAKFLYNKLQSFSGQDIIIAPVPLHSKRLLWRGYNQSCMIANKLAKLMNCSMIPDLLIREKNTQSQGFKTIEERKLNVQKAFFMDKKYKQLVRGKKIIILDDVITTGATIFECARAVPGASEIILASVGRRIRK